MLQVSLTKNIHHELYYSQPTTTTSTYTHLPHEDNHSLVSEEMFPPSTLPTTRNIDLQDIYLPAKHIVKSTATTNSLSTTTTSTTTTASDRRLSRRYQPYNNNKKNTTTNNNTLSSTTQTTIVTSPLEESFNMEPLFGPVISSNYQCSSPSMPQPSLILDDEEVFEEFDSFISSPTRFLSSPPPSPTLSPFENDETNEDLDFNDYPLFP